MMNGLKITVLGSGNAFGDGQAFQSCHLFEIGKNKILFDCGPAILQAEQKALDINLDDLKYLFITHLHGDHMSGVPFLILKYKYVVKRFNNPILIIGPKGLKKQIQSAIEGSYPGLLLEDDNLFEVKEIDFQETVSISEEVKIFPFEAHHIPNAFCYSIKINGIKIVYSGDNELKPDQFKEMVNSDILIHELTTMNSTQGAHTSWEVMKNYYSDINPKFVILVHTSNDVRNEPQTTFPSNFVRALDGSQFTFDENGNLKQMII